MKVRIDNYFMFLVCLFVLPLLVLSGCETNENTFREFIEEGETIYIGAPDTIFVDPGYKKLRFRIAINADPKISKGALSTLNDEISREFEINRQKDGNDTISLIVDGEEGDYTFEFFLFDEKGNKSIAREVPATVYGENYQNSLLTRRILEMEVRADSLSIDWGEIAEGMEKTIMEYKNSKGELVKAEIEVDAKESYIKDFMRGEEFVVYSVYKPVPNAFEEFISSSLTYYFPAEE